jgi:tetratricopeptide (TPR) repeat protein
MNRLLSNSTLLRVLALSLLVACSVAIYWPGINGPFVFDDTGNILLNDYMKIKDLSFPSLRNAALSVDSGPLNRPIPMLSFALTFHFNDGSPSALPFKLTNIAIHGVNGLLVFWFFYLGLGRIASVDENFKNLKRHHVFILSCAASLLWVAHPIHLTSVLYIVQRMASLSATFVLLALISYLEGRTAAISGRRLAGAIYGMGGVTIFGLMGLFSKENAALLPLYILLLEMTLFSREHPWSTWSSLSVRTRRTITAGLIVAGLLTVAYSVSYFLPGYSGRHFTFTERILSEPRVLLVYLSLIFLPRVEAFGVFHDDISFSTGFFSPWTTLPAITVMSLLLISSAFLFGKHRLISFAILWFFVSHLMESTILPLGLAHEHRNYLAAIGPILAIVYLTHWAILVTGRSGLWCIPGLFLALFVATTFLRAGHWSDAASLYEFEARNHPNSARAQASLGSLYARTGKLSEAKATFLRASELRPYAATDLMNVQIILACQKMEPSDELRQETLRRVHHGLHTPLTVVTLEYAVNHAESDCVELRDELLTWLPIYISRLESDPRRSSYYRYLHAQVLFFNGESEEVISTLKDAIAAYEKYLHPYFLLAATYLRLGDVDAASGVLAQLRRANIDNPHPRDREIQVLSDKIQRAKTSKENRGFR